jgi:anti-sigma factor RsiW
MPDCNEIVGMLSEYLDQDLPPDSCSRVDEHLRSCPQCAGAAASLRRTVALCRQFRADNCPGPLRADKQRELRTAFEKALDALRREPPELKS